MRDDQAEALRARALAFLSTAPIGTRVVVRFLDGDLSDHGDGDGDGSDGDPDPRGARDALGELLARTGTTCTVRTRRETLDVPLADVVAARAVPPPPAPRIRGTRS